MSDIGPTFCSLAAVSLTSVSFSLCTLNLLKNNQNNKANWQITPMGMSLCLVCAITKRSFISSMNRRSDFELNWQNTVLSVRAVTRDLTFSLPTPMLIPKLRVSADTNYQSDDSGLFFPKFKTCMPHWLSALGPF